MMLLTLNPILRSSHFSFILFNLKLSAPLDFLSFAFFDKHDYMFIPIIL